MGNDRCVDAKEWVEKGLLGYRNYEADKKEFFEEDFADVKTVQRFLNQVVTGEADLTKSGKQFFHDEFYNNDLALRLVEIGGLEELWPEEKVENPDAIINWFDGIKANEIEKFIHGSD